MIHELISMAQEPDGSYSAACRCGAVTVKAHDSRGGAAREILRHQSAEFVASRHVERAGRISEQV
jgi:hypothetical protein